MDTVWTRKCVALRGLFVLSGLFLTKMYWKAASRRLLVITRGAYTIYMENPEIPVGKSNGTHHSIWSTSEIMGFWSK